MFTITDCPRCGKDFMYHGQDSYLFRNVTTVDEVGNNEIIDVVICQDCDEVERLDNKSYMDKIHKTQEVMLFINPATEEDCDQLLGMGFVPVDIDEDEFNCHKCTHYASGDDYTCIHFCDRLSLNGYFK